MHGDLPAAVLIVGREGYEDANVTLLPGTIMEVGSLTVGTTLDGILFRADEGS